MRVVHVAVKLTTWVDVIMQDLVPKCSWLWAEQPLVSEQEKEKEKEKERRCAEG